MKLGLPNATHRPPGRRTGDFLRRLVHALMMTATLTLASFGVAAAVQPTVDRSVVERLSGFDQQRVAAVGDWLQTPEDAARLAEAAKLLFQVNRLARTTLAAPPIGSAPHDHPAPKSVTGDAVAITGTATTVAAATLPPELADVLEFDRIYRVEIQTTYPASGNDGETSDAPNGPTLFVLTTSIPSAWLARGASPAKLTEPTSAVGVVVQADAKGRPRIIAAPELAWFPTTASPAGADWALLASRGLNVSLLEDVRARDRKPLLAADHEAFYAMLKASDALAAASLPPPDEVAASELLRNSRDWVGRRLRLRCQSVRVTRIMISNAGLRAALGTDHYWQLDALGDLGNVVIRIEPDDREGEDNDTDDRGAGPVTFEDRYPVSLVALSLPDFLQARFGEGAPSTGGRRDVLLHSQQWIVDGFFYRLWSYESDFMRRHGGADQFGPLLMATQIYNDELPAGDVDGVGMIGKGAAAAAVVMILVTALWVYVTSRQDAAARRRRLARSEPDQWPSEPGTETRSAVDRSRQ